MAFISAIVRCGSGWSVTLKTSTVTLAALVYLGALVNGKHQTDPSLLGCATGESKQDTMVFFQWQHVTKGRQKKPVIKGMRVRNALHDKHVVLGWPLKSISQGINFSMEFLNDFADWKKPGTTYHGISYPAVGIGLVHVAYTWHVRACVICGFFIFHMPHICGHMPRCIRTKLIANHIHVEPK